MQEALESSYFDCVNTDAKYHARTPLGSFEAVQSSRF
jgi:hypothetical protein